MKRLAFILLSLFLLAAPPVVEAQQPARPYRIAWLHPQPVPSEWVAGFYQGLKDLGWVEGRDVIIDRRWGDGNFDRLPTMAAELVRSNPDAIIAGNTAALRALKEATQTIPIVMMGPGDALGAGLIRNLARPGGNITGLHQGFMPDLSAKGLELLKEVVPGIVRVTVLNNPGNPSSVLSLQVTQSAAKQAGLTVHVLDVRKPREVDQVLSTVVRERPDALVLLGDSMIHTRRRQIADFAVKQRLPSTSVYREFPEAGGLISYGVSIADIFRRSVAYLDKIFKGDKPGDLPVEQPTRFELVVNAKTAKALGLTIPPSVLLRADEVIQ